MVAEPLSHVLQSNAATNAYCNWPMDHSWRNFSKLYPQDVSPRIMGPGRDRSRATFPLGAEHKSEKILRCSFLGCAHPPPRYRELSRSVTHRIERKNARTRRWPKTLSTRLAASHRRKFTITRIVTLGIQLLEIAGKPFPLGSD